MQEQELDQFLVDYYAPSDSIEVNCVWLQQQLKVAQLAHQQVNNLRTLLEKATATIERQQLTITVYEDLRKSRKRLVVKEYYV